MNHSIIINDGPNGHLFYVGGDLMMRRGMLPIIMLPDGDLRIALHLVLFWILTIWGSVHIEETMVGWRKQLHHTRGAPIAPVVLPLHGTVVGRDYLPEASPGSEPGMLARQRWHVTATPLSQIVNPSNHIIWYTNLPRTSYQKYQVLQQD